MDEKKLHTAAVALQWEARYRKGEHLAGKGAFLPDLDTLDADFARALDLYGVKSGKLLDVGTGLGNQAIRYAELGFVVTATDVSPTSVENARKSAYERGVNANSLTFVADNILATSLQGPFDVITDRGCYTLFEEWMRKDYCCNIHSLLSPNGLLLLKTDAGKNVPEELVGKFRVIRSWDTRYHEEKGPKAVFHVLNPCRSQIVEKYLMLCDIACLSTFSFGNE